MCMHIPCTLHKTDFSFTSSLFMFQYCAITLFIFNWKFYHMNFVEVFFLSIFYVKYWKKTTELHYIHIVIHVHSLWFIMIVCALISGWFPYECKNVHYQLSYSPRLYGFCNHAKVFKPILPQSLGLVFLLVPWHW